MKPSNEIYMITTDNINPLLPMAEAIRATTAVARNFKKAYDLAQSMGEIKEPSIGYKAALERTNKHQIVELEDKDGTTKAVIVLIKRW